MNKRTISNIAKRVLFVSILSVVILFAAHSTATASENNVNKDTAINVNNAENVSVKYIGSTEDGLYFNVKYNNEKGQNFDIVIKNESGEVLYNGSFSDKSFDKKFLLPQDESVSYISISLKSGNDNFAQSYGVTINSDTYNNVVVTKNYISTGVSGFLN